MAKFKLIIILISLLVLTNNITKPFYGHHDWNGAYYANIARNYLLNGYWATKFGQATSTGINPPEYYFYTHYPPLFSWLLSIDYRFLGISEASTKAIPIIFTTLTLLTLYQIARLLKFSPLVSLAGLLIIFTPMLRYFGKMPSQEALMVFFTCLSAYSFLSRNHKLFYFSVVANGLTGWAGYFFYPWLFFLNRRLAMKAVLILTGIFGLHLIHIYILTGSAMGGNLLEALLLRLNLTEHQFTLKQYLIQEARWLTVYYTLTVLALALANLMLMLKKIGLKEKMILVFLGWGLSYPLIFTNVVFIHEYFNIFFYPFLALSLVNLMAKIKWPAVAILILALVIFGERNRFYQALEQTHAHQDGYELGQVIKANTVTNEPVLVIASSQFISEHEVFIKYSADRSLVLANYDFGEALPAAKNIFTVTFDQPAELFIDAALATQAAEIKNLEKFNYYKMNL